MMPEETSLQPGFLPIPEPENGGIHRFAHEAMATVFEIFCAQQERQYAQQAAAAAFDLVDQLEGELSCHLENSDISRINHLRTGQDILVSSWTMDCLVLARCFYMETREAFDISLGSGFETLELFPADLVVRAGTEGVRLNLGGIGKGYAVDRAGEILEEWGIHRALLHAGFSSVLALDAPAGKDGWRLTMSRPGEECDPVFARLIACRQVLSSSGIRKGDHILDPRTGLAVRKRPGAWVAASIDALTAICHRLKSDWGVPESVPGEVGVSPSGAAEAFSTAFMVLSLEEIETCCRCQTGLQAWVLESNPANPLLTPSLTHFSYEL